MKLLIVIGTRPEAIKLAPVVQLARKTPEIDVTVVSTGQHREMLDQTCAALDMRIDIDLRIMEHCKDLCDIAARTIQEMGRVISDIKPDWIVVQGDTSTAAAAGMAGFYHKCRVAHVEAGLRSYDNNHPFPEEVNRKIVAAFAERHFAPTDNAYMNLVAEGVPEAKILMTGNTVIDALMMVRNKIKTDAGLRAQIMAELPPLDDGRRTVLITAHRRENHGDGLAGICAAVRRLSADYPDTQFVFPVHLNPNVQQAVTAGGLHDLPNVRTCAPLSYFTLVHLMSRSFMILTDSGGIQEEASAFSAPVLVLREKTERMEGVEAGIARLVGADTAAIVENARELMDNPRAYAHMARAEMPYGDGKAAGRIIDALLLEPHPQTAQAKIGTQGLVA